METNNIIAAANRLNMFTHLKTDAYAVKTLTQKKPKVL
jgi:hypothetical protein